MDCGDSVLCCLQNLIRMNFSNNPLLARVDDKGKTKTGLSFVIFCCLTKPLHLSLNLDSILLLFTL